MDINISEAEWEVMRVVWSNKETTSKFVIDTLGEEKSWTPSTIKTLLSRLVEKGFLETRKQGNKFLYSAKCVEDECLEILTQNFLERICERRTHIIVKNIIEEDNLSKSNIDEIIELLQEKRKTAAEVITCKCLKGQCSCAAKHG